MKTLTITNGHLPVSSWAEDDRPVDKLLLKGKHTLSDAELLSIIIGNGTKDKTSVDIAREMLAAHGNDIHELSKKSVHDYTKFANITKAKAVAICAAFEIGKRRESAANDKPLQKFVSDKMVYEMMQPLLSDLPHEEFWIICLNRNCRFISKHRMSSGGVSGTVADMKLIFNTAVKELACGLILCHNHPSGNLNPSEHDKILTRKAIEAGRFLEIDICDHVIVAGNNYYSFRENNML